jgi:hypothetical protein
MKRHDSSQLSFFPVLDQPRAGPTFDVLERELRDARTEVRNLQVLQMKPGSRYRESPPS